MPRWRARAVASAGRARRTAPTGDKVKALLAGEADANDSYVEINAGAGGTESQDWAGDAQPHVHALGRAPRA